MTIKENMEITNSGLAATVDQFGELNREIHTASEIIIPLMRDYLKELQSVRMAFAREVLEIMRSSEELGKLKKMLPELEELARVVTILRDLADDEKIKIMRKLISE